MEMMAGYKQTELGIIPNEWEVVSIQNLIDTNAIIGHLDGNHGALYPRSHEFVEYGVPYITANELTGYKVSFKTCKYLSKERARRFRKGVARNGDVLFAHNATVGPTALLETELDYVILSTTATYFRCNPEKIRNAFLLYALKSQHFVGQYQAIMAQSTRNQVPITAQRKLSLVIPPISEQEAIAETLSDADALIEALEQLLAKKRQVKQGAMQELLRVKDNWVATNLGSIADPNKRWSYTGGPFGSNLKASDYIDDGIRVIQLQNIGDGEFKADYEVYTSKQKADELLSCNIYPGEIILSKMGDPVARACIIPSLHERYVMCSDGIRLAVDQKRFNTYFVYTVINARDFRTKAENAGVGSTRKRIGLTELRNLELFCPPLPEQTTIVEILSDMDAEIAALEAKLSKARQVKQGMMSVLLTGRVRLV